MGLTMTRTCDFPDGRHPKGGTLELLKVELTIDDIIYRADVCTRHKADMVNLLQEAFNFRPIASWVKGRRRDAHIAASGAVFTSADVREWAIEEGLGKGAGNGRVPIEHIELYAASH